MRVVINGECREFPAGSTLSDALAARGTGERGIAVAVDNEIVPRGSWPTTRLTDDARVEIMTAVHGG